VKGQAAVLHRDLRGMPQLYADGLHIVPHADGTVAVGSTSERDWDDPVATDRQLDEVIARARAACPALRDAPGDRALGGHPAARPVARADPGAHPPVPERSSPMAASRSASAWRRLWPLMADLVVDGIDRIPPEFRPEASLT
jgi:glycine oxidase